MGGSDQGQKRLTPKEELQELFSKCKQHVEAIKSIRQIREESIRRLAFPSFATFASNIGLDPPPALDSSPTLKNDELEHYAIRYLILDNKTRKGNRETRWRVLACWLRDVGICEPREFLPENIYKELTADARKRFRGVMKTDFRHYLHVESWRPYFERLLADRANTDSTGDLTATGYEEGAVQAALNKREPVPAICDWLETIEEVDPITLKKLDANTLKNAHARVARRSNDYHKISDRNL